MLIPAIVGIVSQNEVMSELLNEFLATGVGQCVSTLVVLCMSIGGQD